MTYKFTKRKKVYGVGVNDADYPTQVNGKHCPYYLRWKTMLLRVYKKPYDCYDNVRVCEEWLTFSNFKRWMETQDWEGKHLDKDLLGDGTLYSPETCCFIPENVNTFLTGNKKGAYKTGVRKEYNRFSARCCNPFTGKREVLRTHSCETAAYFDYVKKKQEHAFKLADTLEEPMASALRDKFSLTGRGFGNAGRMDFDFDTYMLSPVIKEEPKVPDTNGGF